MKIRVGVVGCGLVAQIAHLPNPYLKNAPTIVRVEETIGGTLIEQEIVASYDEADKRELKHFHDCVANEMEPRTDGEDGKKDLELALHIIHRCAPIADSSD